MMTASTMAATNQGTVRALQRAEVGCGNGVVMSLSQSAPKQGSIVVVELRSDSLLQRVGGSVDGKPLHFWTEGSARIHQALLGIDFLASPGMHSVKAHGLLESESRSSERFDCRSELPVVDGEFPVQHLSVAPKFVELSPEDLARSRRETEEINHVFSSSASQRYWRNFVAPVPGHERSGSFGKRRVFNGQPRSPHSGEDFSAPAGTPVRATARGRVALAKGLFFLGNTVMLDHGQGLISFYGHLSSIGVELDQIVEADTVIGQVGATGRVTGAHLHWGVRLGNARVNPVDLLTIGR
jgi:murein DD-endopeptidase MepM/ murein hydrolase activator NlpD